MIRSILLFVVVIVLVCLSMPAAAAVLCANQSGSVFVRPQCLGNERPLDPVALGLIGPPGPPGTVASFDDLEGLPCTRNGEEGTIEITYAANGDATVRCLLSQPPPAGDISGTYGVNPAVSYTCSLVTLDIRSFVFHAAGSELSVTGAPVAMSGTASGNSFNVQGHVISSVGSGTVTETYTLSGVFRPDNATWDGTFQVLFATQEGAVHTCSLQAFPNLVGTRQ